MSIVSHEIERLENIGFERRMLTARYEDSVGGFHQRIWTLTPDVTDVDQFVTDQTPSIDAELQAGEINAAMQDAKAGINPDRVPLYQSQVDFDRKIFGQLMSKQDPSVTVDTRLTVLPYWLSRQTTTPPGWGSNKNARADFLGVPRIEYSELDAVYGDLQGIKGGVDSINEKLWDETLEAWK